MIIFKQAWLALIKLWFINITWPFLFRKTTYSRPLEVKLFSKSSSFQKAAVHCTRISRGYFALGGPDCLGYGLWAEIPLASWLFRGRGLGFAPHQVFQTGPGRRSSKGHWQEEDTAETGCGEGKENGISGVLHPPHISHSTGQHQWGMPKPMAIALGCTFQICSPRSSFLW